MTASDTRRLRTALTERRNVSLYLGERRIAIGTPSKLFKNAVDIDCIEYRNLIGAFTGKRLFFGRDFNAVGN